MGVKENLHWAKKAVHYLDKLNIKSVNVPFRIKSYYKSPLSEFDVFLFEYMRAETRVEVVENNADFYMQTFEIPDRETFESKLAFIPATKKIRSHIIAILHSNKTKQQKKLELQKLMKMVKAKGYLHPLSVFTTIDRTTYPDESRIRACRKAIKFGHGNCGEKSAIVATYLVEKLGNSKSILWACSNPTYDHAFVLLADQNRLTELHLKHRFFSDWDESTVVVDGWTSDYYAFKHPFNPLKAGSIANPFQAYVRRKLHNLTIGSISCMEEVHNNWPPQFDPHFRLATAHLSKHDPARLHGSQMDQELSAVSEVADNGDELITELKAVLARRGIRT